LFDVLQKGASARMRLFMVNWKINPDQINREGEQGTQAT